MREIILDIESTGLDYKNGEKIIEIAAIEIYNGSKSGNYFHTYINPGKIITYEAYQIHGIPNHFLFDKPYFSMISKSLTSFLSNSIIIAHNAEFDIGFINYEFLKLGIPFINNNRVLDTVFMAKTVFPGSRVNLDVLCSKLFIDLSNRKKHGAMIDVDLLFEVYTKLKQKQKQIYSSTTTSYY